ncbi:hypothetical protein [Hydrogenophaga sp.]|uniref:hypothetical protein n=1 Tax=Hydrogenophaga sp. TaxID=1904254 RepID=UPI0027165CF5|nr:hypothetical protein [Hydrogenophaga sp.]MDO9437310.1 hypothetical protein [Hydrogenophaga sp.]
MTQSRISTRRQIITVVLLVAALAGGVVRWLAPDPSLARNLGSLMMVLWLPIIGNVIAWGIHRAKTPKSLPQGFAPGTAFEPHARIELTLLPADTPLLSRPIRAGYFDGALVVGSEGFTTRLAVPHEEEPVPEVPCTLEVQFARPELALAKLTVGTKFALLSGRTLLGTGYVVPTD